MDEERKLECIEETKEGFIKIPKTTLNAQNKCILFCQSFGRQIPMYKQYIGLHLEVAGFFLNSFLIDMI